MICCESQLWVGENSGNDQKTIFDLDFDPPIAIPDTPEPGRVRALPAARGRSG
jgi:hypothetical protein